MAEYRFFKVGRDDAGRVRQAILLPRPNERAISYVNTDPFRLVITDKGICVNGDYGSNPSAAEMRELAALIVELADAWKAKQDGGHGV